MSIGERIAKCRKEKNLSQEYVAELLDVSRQAVSKWENDQSEPDTGNLIQLARVFGVSVEYLANGEEEAPKVVYVEKSIPTFKIIGIVLLALGGLCGVLGVLMPYMFGIAIVTAAFGILLMLLKKEGLILGGVIIVLGTVLFLIQGIFFGLDTPIMCLIAAISVGLPTLTYAIIKLVQRIKAEGTINKLKDNPTLIKRIIIVVVIAAIVITAVVIPISIVNKNRRNAFAKALWFSSDKLSEYMVEGLPAPRDVDCVNLNSEKILFHFNTDEYNDYLKSVYDFLISKNFKHLGTRGEIEGVSSEGINYEFIKHDKGKRYGAYKHSGFNSNENPDDYYFIYSNSELNEVTGEIDCCIIRFNEVGISTAVIDGKRFTYNVEMSIYRESELEGYKYPSFNITYGTNFAHLFLENNPAESIQGKEIKVKTRAISNDHLNLCIDGKPIQRTFANEEYWEYTFTMPDHDVLIEARLVENDPIVPPSLGLVSFESWLNGLTKEDIAEIKIETTYGSNSSPFSAIQRTTDKFIIGHVLEQYRNVCIEPVDIGDIALEGSGTKTTTFILEDGTVRTLHFAALCYKLSESEYYRVSDIPDLSGYDSNKINKSLSLSLSEETHTVYSPDGAEVITIETLHNLEFSSYTGDASYDVNDPLYYIETELGQLYICSETVFMFKGTHYEYQCYELTNGSFYELFENADDAINQNN